jgi:hypothetical protein
MIHKRRIITLVQLCSIAVCLRKDKTVVVFSNFFSESVFFQSQFRNLKLSFSVFYYKYGNLRPNLSFIFHFLVIICWDQHQEYSLTEIFFIKFANVVKKKSHFCIQYFIPLLENLTLWRAQMWPLVTPRGVCFFNLFIHCYDKENLISVDTYEKRFKLV